jgi:hypothetical protein
MAGELNDGFGTGTPNRIKTPAQHKLTAARFDLENFVAPAATLQWGDPNWWLASFASRNKCEQLGRDHGTADCAR